MGVERTGFKVRGENLVFINGPEVSMGELALGDNPRTVETPDFGITKAHAEIAERSLKAVQIALEARRFAATWKSPRGAAGAAAADIMLVRRLWIHSLLANDWLSVNRLALITERDHRTIEYDRDLIALWSAADGEFRDLVSQVEEVVDAVVALFASRRRVFLMATRVADRLRDEKRRKHPPSRRPATIVKADTAQVRHSGARGA